jgi:hypothetical protein
MARYKTVLYLIIYTCFTALVVVLTLCLAYAMVHFTLFGSFH